MAPFAAISGEPAAVLLVDLTLRQVVHANDIAQQLAPGVQLPAGVDAWSDAAVLRDVDGQELSDSSHPLSLVARAQAVHGQAVSAARASELGAQRAGLWVVALPMVGSPRVSGLALVVLLPLRARQAAETAAVAARAQSELRDRAVLATGIAFTVADAREPDQPLLWVNPAFTADTGYSFEEVEGRNCRFLQGEGTDPMAVQELRTAIGAGRHVAVTLLNYRKDGTAFWNQVSLSPIFDGDGQLTHYVGIQSDVTARVESDADRESALAAERAARQEAERAHAQLKLLAEATSQLAATLDEDETLQRLSRLTVPVLADWGVIVTISHTGQVERTVGHHQAGHERDLQLLMQQLQEQIPATVSRTILSSARPLRVSGLPDPQTLLGRVPEPVQHLLDALGTSDVLLVPLHGRDRVLGLMALARARGDSYTEGDLSVATDLGRRAGLALDNARLFTAEHRVAETLQRSLLPTLPNLPGLDAHASYQASESAADVGGDFYELLALPDGSSAVAIGDVVGHDVLAAAAMGHLRGLLRASAWDSGAAQRSTDNDSGNERPFATRRRSDPGAVLTRVDRLLQGLDGSTLATAALARLERVSADAGDAAGGPAPGCWRVRYSNAGHPPMLVRLPDGTVIDLDGSDGVMLGVADLTRTTSELTVPDGSLLLCYTDGLIERRGENLEEGLQRLRDILSQTPPRSQLMCEALMSALGRSDDDVAVLAIALTSPVGTGAGATSRSAQARARP